MIKQKDKDKEEPKILRKVFYDKNGKKVIVEYNEKTAEKIKKKEKLKQELRKKYMDNGKESKYFIRVKDPNEIMTCEDCLLILVAGQYLSKTFTGESICLTIARLLKYLMGFPLRILYYIY